MRSLPYILSPILVLALAASCSSSGKSLRYFFEEQDAIHRVTRCKPDRRAKFDELVTFSRVKDGQGNLKTDRYVRMECASGGASPVPCFLDRSTHTTYRFFHAYKVCQKVRKDYAATVLVKEDK